MTRKRIAGIIIGLSALLLVAVLATVYFKKPGSQQPSPDDLLAVEAKTIRVNDGWGYDIYVDNKRFIHQDIVPGVQGVHHFATEAGAKTVAALLIQKLLRKQDLLITPAEMDSMQIEIK